MNWVVIVYDDVRGFQFHTVQGAFYHLWRHYGHNIVVGRLINPGLPYTNLNSLFWNAYSPQYDSSGFWGWGPKVLNAERTVESTWNGLVSRGVTPVMLHILRSDISYSVTSYFSTSYLVTTSLNGNGFATLIA